MHYIEHEGGELKHTEFLAYPGADPRRALAEQLCKDIPRGVCTTAYNMGFEKGRIKGLAEIYPDLADHLMNIHDNIQDLMIPFQRKYYYTKAMQGSYSIKYVLPALFPDDPSLDYHNLEGAHNGSEASATFKRMATMSQGELEAYRRHLLNIGYIRNGKSVGEAKRGRRNKFKGHLVIDSLNGKLTRYTAWRPDKRQDETKKRHLPG